MIVIKPLSRSTPITHIINTIPNPGYEHFGAPPPKTWNNLPLGATDPKAVINLWENYRQQPKSTGTPLQGRIYPVLPQVNGERVMIRGIPRLALAKNVMFKIYALNQVKQLVAWADTKAWNPTKPRYLIITKYVDCHPASEVPLSPSQLQQLRHLTRGHILKTYQIDVGEDSKDFCYTTASRGERIAIDGWMARFV
ncbi:hypothetical protein F5887DRAFT_1080452 [Amanita rubescens]|nr:hypothetical protein F5887DRAFT_1080452 [Amanita rubescens]